jgi:hypothetical protein
MVMTATPSCVVRFTSFSIVVIPLPHGRGSVVAEREFAAIILRLGS